jgi:hypothetical protein
MPLADRTIRLNPVYLFTGVWAVMAEARQWAISTMTAPWTFW